MIDQIELGDADEERALQRPRAARCEQVRKATEIISHLRTFGRAAPASFEPVDVDDVLERALSLMHEQLRLRQIEVALDLVPRRAIVIGNAIQLEQVFINLLTNARDALADAERQGDPRQLAAARTAGRDRLRGHRAAASRDGLEQRIFDPFFTTKEVGAGHRPRALDHLRHRPGPPRRDLARQTPGEGRGVPDRAPAGGDVDAGGAGCRMSDARC